MPQPAPAPRCGPVASRAQGRAVGEGSQLEPKQQLDIAQVPSPANAFWGKKGISRIPFFQSRESTARRPTRGPLGAILGPSWGPLLERVPTRISKFEPRGARFEALWPSGALLVATAGRARKTGQFGPRAQLARQRPRPMRATSQYIYVCIYIYIYRAMHEGSAMGESSIVTERERERDRWKERVRESIMGACRPQMILRLTPHHRPLGGLAVVVNGL